MKFERKLWVCRMKAYFQKGESLISYGKYLIAFFGLASREITITLFLGGLYAILSFMVGWQWYRRGMINAEIEIQNRFNLFVNEVREKLIYNQ